MKLKEVQPGMSGVRIKVKIREIGPIRDVKTRYGNKVRVATATIYDDSAEAKLTLWADQIEKVKPDDIIEIVNGLAREWQGEIQISVGKKRGELKVVQE